MKSVSVSMLPRVSFIFILQAGCHESAGDCIAAASISKNGFDINATAMRDIDRKEINLWGFVDYGNLYGNDSAKSILQEWWSGDGPDATSWRFNLKAHAHDPVGQSFAVHVRNDSGRDELLSRFREEARAGKATCVFVKGKVFAFNAPTNTSLLAGMYMEVASSKNIQLATPTD